MVESLGMVDRFFNDDEHAYAFPAFSSWVQDDVTLPSFNNISVQWASTLTSWNSGATNSLAILRRTKREVEHDAKRQGEFNRILDLEREIPSFSFPLDTTMFAAESKSRKRLAHVARYSRDTKLALSELAPGQIRTVDGKRMKIGGLYFEYSRDRVNRAREFFDWFFTLQENKVSMCLNDFCRLGERQQA